MVQLFKSFRAQQNINFRVTPEVPLLSFNKMCYGVLQNDWCLILSSIVTFFFSIGHLIYSGGEKM